jgi:nitrogen fixation negative regulator NifL
MRAARLLAAVLFLLLPIFEPASLQAQTALPDRPGQPQVLVLYSYGDGGKSIDVFTDGLRSVMNRDGFSTNDMYLENLDIERTRDDRGYRLNLSKLLLEKYARRNIGLVVAVQQPAMDFLLHEGREIAPKAPVITVLGAAPTGADAHGRRVVSQLANVDVNGTLKLALALFPQTRRVLLVAGSSEADLQVAARAEQAAAPWRGKLEIEASGALSIDQLMQKVARLPADTIVLFAQYNRDGSGRATLSYEVEEKLAKAANAPVFGLFDFNIVNGGIGGSVVSVRALGERTGTIALDILAGKLQLNQPMLTVDSAAIPMFDWSQVERWGGDPSRLPKEAVFVNRSLPFWERYRAMTVGLAIIFIALSATTIGLLISRRRRMAAEKLLIESEGLYRLRLDAALEQQRRHEEGLELLLELNQAAQRMTERQIFDRALEIAVTTTRSEIGYLHQLDEDQNTIALVAWNAEALKYCSAVPESHYPIDAAGIWADCVRQRQPVIHNDYQNMPHMKGVPDGHSHLIRHMSVSAIDSKRVHMIVGVGNKAFDYSVEDSKQLQMLANEVNKIVMRHRTEQALEDSEARFRFITDLSPAAVWVADANKRCTWFNKTWLDMTGRSLEQELGRGWQATIHPDDLEAGLAFISDRIDRREPFTVEFRIRRHDGEYRWLLDTGHPRFDENGEFEGYVGTGVDITERKRAEEQLRKLWLAVEQTSHSIVITDLDARIEYVNRAFSEISGYAAEEVIGKNPGVLQSGQTSPATYADMWHTLWRGDIWQGEFHNRRKNGEIFIESVRISPVRQADGRITNYLAIKEDVSEQRRVAEAIRESRILLQRVVDSTPDLIFVKNRERRFMLVNAHFAKFFNLTPEEMIGRQDSEFLPLEMFDGNPGKGIRSVRSDDESVFNGESISDSADKVFLADGKFRVFETLKVPLRDSSQAVYGILCSRRDVTARFNAEQQHEALETQLRQAQKMELIGHLTGGIAHDFNNILASMLGFAEIIQMSAEIKRNPKLSEYLQEILQAGIRAKELVAQLLVFSHKREEATEAIFVAPIVKEVAKLLRSTMPASISIKAEMAKDLPQVLISPVRLHQILMNLGVNAHDAMADSGALDIRVEALVLNDSTICASCQCKCSGSHVMISVRDTGSGIAPESRLRIFDPFYTTKPVGRGSGLGLSVLHGIVHSANGHIEVISAPGEGAEFRIYLPAQSWEPARLLREVKPDTGSVQVCGNVMVIDDEASIVGFVTALLEGLGCKVTGLTSASEALRLFRQDPHCVDMVITDQSMPDLTGVELARAMLALRPDIPIVVSSGYSNVINEATARQIGIKRFLNKPVPAKVFADIVAQYLAVKTTGTT